MDSMRQRWIHDDLAEITLRRAVLLIIGIASGLAVVAAVLERLFDPAFDSFGDALWYSVVTVSTVGYGDIVPASATGRIIGSGLMLVGLGLIPLVTSVVVSILVAHRNRAIREAALRDLEVIVERLDRIEARLAGSQTSR
jgi:voltage-gated potassium channel Kch